MANLILHKYLIREKATETKGQLIIRQEVGRGLSGLITVLEDKQYMVTVREKMNNTKKA